MTETTVGCCGRTVLSTAGGRQRCGECCDACRSCCLECWRRIWWRVKVFLNKIMAFMFSHVGLCGLVAGYAILGAFVFRAIELPEEMKRLGHIKNDTEQVVQDLLRYTKSRSVIKPAEWHAFATKLLRDYEYKLVYAMTQEGYDGNDDNPRPQWTLSGGLLYSIAVFTTIGYGNIVPKTKLGRLTTVLYACIGIPLMLLCLANIAETLAQIFTFIYFKLCCAYCRWKKRQRRLRRAAMSIRNAPPGLRRGHSFKTFSAQRGTAIRRVQSVKSAPVLITMNTKKTGPPDTDAKGKGPLRSFQDAKWDTRSLPGGKATTRRDWDTRSLANRRMAPARTTRPEKGRPDQHGNQAAYRVTLKENQKSTMPRANKFPDVEYIGQLPRARPPKCGASCFCAHGSSIAESPMSDIASKDTTAGYSDPACGHVACRRDLETVDLTGMQGEEAISRLTAKPSVSSGSSDARPTMTETSATAIERGKTFVGVGMKAPVPCILVSNGTDNAVLAATSDDEEIAYAEEEESRRRPVETMVTIAAEERSTVTSRRSDEASIRSARKAGASRNRERMPISVGILIVILFIAGGSIMFTVWENWNLFDGAYFSFITLTTIGFGDLVPRSRQSQEKLVICSLYLLIGMALIAMCFKLMQDTVVQRTIWLGQKIGLLVKEQSSDSEMDSEDEGLEEEEEAENSDKTDDKRTMSSIGSANRREDERKAMHNRI